MTVQARVLREASFTPRVVDYWLLSGLLIGILTVVGIPFGILWYVVGRPIGRKLLSHMSCTLTARNLEFRKGWLNRIEKTVPLEKITDLAMFQGPIMRAMDLQGFRVETAGSGGAGTGYLVSLIGIENVDDFRAAVLAQRDAISGRDDEDPGRSDAPARAEGLPQAGTRELLEAVRGIRDSVERIEAQLARTPGSATPPRE